MAGASEGLVRIDRMGQAGGTVAILVLSHPPANLWTEGMEHQLIAALGEVEADPEVTCVILRGEGRGFSAGMALEAALDPAGQEGLQAACARVSACTKPVIAAIHGAALGAGCALALAAHWRIAHEAAVIGLPEVSLGLVPGGGATQRLPRLIGLEQALRIALAARPIPAAEALALGLVDEVSTGVLGQAALAMAARKPAPRRVEERLPADLPRLSALIAKARAEVAAAPIEAPQRLIDCIEAAALMPFAAGLTLEATTFADLAATPEAAGLVHALGVERRVLALPPGATLPEIKSVGLIGAEGFAADLSLQAVKAGIEVVLVDPDRAALTAALATVVGDLDAEVKAGRLTEADREAAWNRMAAGQGVDLPEGLDLALVPPGDERPGTSTLGAALRRAGLTPAEGQGGLAELSIGPEAQLAEVLRLHALGRRLGWRVVPVGPGGPLELGLRLALEQAIEALTPGNATLRETLAAAGIGGTGRGAPRPGAQGAIRAALAALAAEGIRMIEDGRARSAAEVDAVALLSGLVPRWLGGPMFQASRRGLLLLRADLRKQPPLPVFATPALLDALIAEGRSLD